MSAILAFIWAKHVYNYLYMQVYKFAYMHVYTVCLQACLDAYLLAYQCYQGLLSAAKLIGDKTGDNSFGENLKKMNLF